MSLSKNKNYHQIYIVILIILVLLCGKHSIIQIIMKVDTNKVEVINQMF